MTQKNARKGFSLLAKSQPQTLFLWIQGLYA
jgi:hypothetical protein